jgi:hypothetical protein
VNVAWKSTDLEGEGGGRREGRREGGGRRVERVEGGGWRVEREEREG